MLARALRCVDALATESERRGYKITGTTSGIVVAVRGHRTSIEFKEPQDRSPHEPTPAEIAEDAKWSWRTYPAYDYKPSGRLRIEVGYSRFEDPKPKADGRLTGRPVEDRLAEVLARAEARALEAEAADRYREEQAARRRRHWEEVRAQAIIDYGEHYRAQALLDQAARFTETRRLDEYLAALDDHIAGMFDPDERAAAEEWREWASEYRQRRDPFARAPRMPTVPDPNHDDLAPFMRGLSVWDPA